MNATNRVNVHSIAIQVPITDLAQGGVTPTMSINAKVCETYPEVAAAARDGLMALSCTAGLCVLEAIMQALRAIAKDRPVLFPVHPRTRARLDAARLDVGAVKLMEPVGYLEMLDLMDAAHAVVTDSGGLQVESAALGVPCLTVRDTTEWPETVACGANQLIYDPAGLPAAVAAVQRLAQPARPEGWDGMAAVRAVDCLRTR